MKLPLKPDEARLLIYHEGRKRRIYVGELAYSKKEDCYVFTYDKEYVRLKIAIPIGPELDLFKRQHKSARGKLFPSFVDRIPVRANPAYEDYCRSQGISADERNPIILLGTIGRRGPSTFVYELVYRNDFSIAGISKLREQLCITIHDLSNALDIKELTLQKIATGKSQDYNTLKLLQIYFEFPEVALWQLQQTGCKIHSRALIKLIDYFEKKYKQQHAQDK